MYKTSAWTLNPFICWRQSPVETQSELTLVDLFWFPHCIEWHVSIGASVGRSAGIPPAGTMLMGMTLAVITSSHSAPSARLSSYITDNIYRRWVNLCVGVVRMWPHTLIHSGWVFIWEWRPSPEIGLQQEGLVGQRLSLCDIEGKTLSLRSTECVLYMCRSVFRTCRGRCLWPYSWRSPSLPAVWSRGWLRGWQPWWPLSPTGSRRSRFLRGSCTDPENSTTYSTLWVSSCNLLVD